MKDAIEIFVKYLLGPITHTVGLFTIGLFALSFVKEYAWITKAVVLFVMTH